MLKNFFVGNFNVPVWIFSRPPVLPSHGNPQLRLPCQTIDGEDRALTLKSKPNTKPSNQQQQKYRDTVPLPNPRPTPKLSKASARRSTEKRYQRQMQSIGTSLPPHPPCPSCSTPLCPSPAPLPLAPHSFSPPRTNLVGPCRPWCEDHINFMARFAQLSSESLLPN